MSSSCALVRTNNLGSVGVRNQRHHPGITLTQRSICNLHSRLAAKWFYSAKPLEHIHKTYTINRIHRLGCCPINTNFLRARFHPPHPQINCILKEMGWQHPPMKQGAPKDSSPYFSFYCTVDGNEYKNWGEKLEVLYTRWREGHFAACRQRQKWMQTNNECGHVLTPTADNVPHYKQESEQESWLAGRANSEVWSGLRGGAGGCRRPEKCLWTWDSSKGSL